MDASPRKATLFDQSLSTPPATPTTAWKENSRPQSSHGSVPSSAMTPPSSPWLYKSPAPPSLITPKHETRRPSSQLSRSTTNEDLSQDTPVPRCPFDFEILKDDRGRDATFGSGAWSIVFKASTHPKAATSTALTPPTSPTKSLPTVVAVKKPCRRDASAILRSEAQMLSYLHTIPYSEKYVVPFHGTAGPDDTTLVLDAIPYSLEDHIRKYAYEARQDVMSSLRTMHEPIVGSVAQWLNLANSLVSGLAWLHNIACVVHGDVKPGNILLRPRAAGSSGSSPQAIEGYEPVYADFSSSTRLDVDDISPNTLAAVTREYTAPELLSSKVLRDPTSCATTSSDVFSLAVTLLVAATGELLVYSGSVFQRQLMATQGWLVLSHVRGGDQGSRVPTGGVVEKVLQRAVLKDEFARVSALEWLEIVEQQTRTKTTNKLQVR
ncbi:hypothetical protein PV08_10550 [Exophiala spinifera]|uniref:Protein kinase domain-containing protein n=1 Tax=Exophiala spinifera TaxID=91928 RepID=A0A0D2AXS2_9EURO|nr:uncharacterized protein PV08_10550 [Exophiala spinifera]KIW11250.1 hypothetical protein PV08_10550 [Exophiala spinifera]